MKRSNFLKTLAFSFAAPSILIYGTDKKEIPAITEALNGKPETGEQNLSNNTVTIITQDANKCRVGDMIVSDMGSKGIIVAVMSGNPGRITVRAMVTNTYHYKDPKVFFNMANVSMEK